MAASLRNNARKIVCIGRNYADHIKELKNVRPKQPLFFLKPQSSILLPGRGPVLKPKGVDVDHEVELAVVMASWLEDSQFQEDDLESASRLIEGYAVGIDMTGRNVQEEAKKKGLPWTVAKGFDTFLPLSGLIPKSKIPSPHSASVNIWLSVNGEMRQSDSPELMIYRIPHLLNHISRVMTLEKGDLILTGTPKGVGPVKPGDIIKAGVKVDGQEVSEGNIEVEVKERGGPYVFGET